MPEPMDYVAVKQEDIVPGENQLLQKFAQLWFACYFERRLTKQKVEEADLQVIVRELISYFSTETIDFKRAIPLLHGLHVLFSKKIHYLLKDSEEMLQQMKNPIADLIKVEDEPENKVSPAKSKAKHRDVRYKGATEGFKINPKNFDWFMAGIDYEKLRKIITDVEDHDEHVKLENTFAMVRADEELQGLNHLQDI